MIDSSKLLGKNGSKHWDSSDGANTDNCYMIIVTSAAEFSALTEKGAVNVLSEQNLSGKTVPAQTVITPKRGHFDGFTLTSGKVQIYLV